jgi:hypothetical protein
MKSSILAIAILASVSFASEDRLVPEMPVFGFQKANVVRSSVVSAPSVVKPEMDTVASVVKPFKDAAWEGKKTFKEENHIIVLGLGY